jgi:flagellar assembly protein FliH
LIAMALAQKFLFDISFDAPGGDARQRGSVTPAEPIFTRADLDAAVAQARAEGHAGGRAEAIGQREQHVAEALSAIAQHLAALFAAKDAALRASERSTIELTRAIAGRLFPALMRKGALAELEAIVVQCMRDAVAEPRLVVRVPDAIFEAAQLQLAPLAASSGYPGKLIILADDTLGESDCRVEWADGGAERDGARSWREIEAAIARAMNALADPAPATDRPHPETAAAGTDSAAIEEIET